MDGRAPIEGCFMAVTVICPNLRCRSVLQVPEQVRGQKVRCGKCGKNFIVPAPSTRKPGSEGAPEAVRERE